MKITLEKEITLASFRKLIRSSKLVKVFARFEGKAKFSVEAEDTEKDKVEIKLGKESQLKIDDLFFGAHGAVSVSGDKVEFKLGIEDFEVTFNPSLTNPISFHVPAIKLPVAGEVFKLEREIPSLGLKGTAQIEVEFVIDVLPNYRQLAKALKPSNVRAALQIAKNKVYTIARRGKAVGRVVVKAGRAAIYAPLKWLGNKIGRQLAIDALKLGSQTAALQKLLGKAGKLLGAAGIALETWLIVKAAIPGLLAQQHKRVIDMINLKFADGYTAVLALYTDVTAPLADKFFEWTTKIERVADEPPDMYGVIETLSRTKEATPPKKDVRDWVDDKIANGIRYRTEIVALSEVDWQALYRESYNIYFLFEGAAQHASNQHREKLASNAISKAWKLVEMAGMIAAYQDIVAFVVNTSLYEDLHGNQPTDVWEEWKNVAEFHRAMFGHNVNDRIKNYMSLIDQGSLTVSIPPFSDYADWAN
ncbi:MAG: hypothetical protein ABW208_18710 [Pyrinomonadaceae bacterium]